MFSKKRTPFATKKVIFIRKKIYKKLYSFDVQDISASIITLSVYEDYICREQVTRSKTRPAWCVYAFFSQFKQHAMRCIESVDCSNGLPITGVFNRFNGKSIKNKNNAPRLFESNDYFYLPFEICTIRNILFILF